MGPAGDISGTDLPGLIAALPPEPESAEAALRDLIAQVADLAVQPPIPSPDDNAEGTGEEVPGPSTTRI